MKEIVGHDQMLDLCIQVQAPDDPSDTLPEVLQKGSQIAADIPTQSVQAAQAFETKTVPSTPPAAVVRVDFFLSIWYIQINFDTSKFPKFIFVAIEQTEGPLCNPNPNEAAVVSWPLVCRQ